MLPGSVVAMVSVLPGCGGDESRGAARAGDRYAVGESNVGGVVVRKVTALQGANAPSISLRTWLGGARLQGVGNRLGQRVISMKVW